MLEAEPAAEPAEAADHLVADQQNPVLAADGLDARPIALRRDDDAAGALHRLADEGRDILRADLEDAVFHRLSGALAEGRRILAEALVEAVRLHHVLDARHPGAALDVHVLHAAEAGAGDGRAVVAVDPGDEDGAVRL